MQSVRRLPQVLGSSGLLRRPCVQSIQRLAAAHTDSQTLSVSLDEPSGIAVMTMNNKPANTLSLESLTEIDAALDKLIADKTCRGLVITSGLRGIFSAGIQITELYQPKQERFNLFWSALQDVMMKVYGSRLATVAAINGHSPAGGCMLSIACDQRIMAAGKYSIGLNETQLGVLVPTWAGEMMLATIGRRQTERATQLGTLFPVETALKIGLIDEVCEESQVLNRAKEEVQTWLKVSDYARQVTKLHMRQPLIDNLMSRKQADIDSVLKVIDTPGVQKNIGLYLEMLKKRSK